jgi:DNA-binding GntR family transcriptional regulator
VAFGPRAIQHRDVLRAIREGDQALAVVAMRSHIAAARYVVLRGVPVRGT